VRILASIVLAVGVLGILISLPLLGLAALGYHGALADVGPAENRNMGSRLLSLGLPSVIGGVVACVLGVLAFAWNRHRTAAEPGAPPPPEMDKPTHHNKHQPAPRTLISPGAVCAVRSESTGELMPAEITERKLRGRAHGKNAVNWIISGFTYAMVGVVLTMVIIGLPLLIVLSVLWIIFPIVAAIKANNGVVWEYPFSIRVLK